MTRAREGRLGRLVKRALWDLEQVAEEVDRPTDEDDLGTPQRDSRDLEEIAARVAALEKRVDVIESRGS